MSGEESQVVSERDGPRKFGLDRLSAEQINRLGSFLMGHVDHMVDPYFQELRDTLLLPADKRQTSIEELAASDSSDLRELACKGIAHYASRHPKEGFLLWRQLMRDRVMLISDIWRWFRVRSSATTIPPVCEAKLLNVLFPHLAASYRGAVT
jgi:hypothetical protein